MRRYKPGDGDYKSPIKRSNLFKRRISNPPERLAGVIFQTLKSAGTPSGVSFSKHSSPLGVPPDLKSGDKKCPNLFLLCGFAIRSKESTYS